MRNLAMFFIVFLMSCSANKVYEQKTENNYLNKIDTIPLNNLNKKDTIIDSNEIYRQFDKTIKKLNNNNNKSLIY